MADLTNMALYRQREAEWREAAARVSHESERAACLALAEGYANLITVLERLRVVAERGVA